MSAHDPPTGAGTSPPARQRLDKWLWFARFARTRALAARHIASNAVRVGGRRVTAAGYQIKLGDVLTLGLPHVTCVVRVRDLGLRRGSAPEARLLYETIGQPDTGTPGPVAHDDPDDAALADDGGTG